MATANPSDVELWRWLYEIIDEPNHTPAEGWGPDVVAHLVPARGKDQLVFRLTANLPPEPGATMPHHYAIGAVIGARGHTAQRQGTRTTTKRAPHYAVNPELKQSPPSMTIPHLRTTKKGPRP
ncbi:MAG: hypothetical protein ACREQ3_21570, partial [Candidatus Binatia bacterium]